VAEALDRLDRDDHPNVWISRVDRRTVMAAAAAVDPSLTLAGTTVAVKDNVDVAGLPTTAGCPAFAYRPSTSATLVERFVAAGAVVVGKTNLDQFATGLTGTRTPYGACRSVLDPSRISGGSSAGSAVAVAAGLSTFAIGTDTAGSGRVPAACNGIVGLKPTRGLLPDEGMVPACRSLDCPSVFTATVADARLLLDVLAPVPAAPLAVADVRRCTVGIPGPEHLAALARPALDAFHAGAARLEGAGVEVVEIDLAPFLAAGDLLYGGAWVAERYHAVGAFIDAHPDDVHPVVRSIISPASGIRASQVFDDSYRLAELRREAGLIMAQLDALLVPTVPDVPTIAAVVADPLAGNTALGRYMTFVNMLGFCAVAVPGPPRADGVPAGVTVVARGGDDRLAVEVGALLEGEPLAGRTEADRIEIVVVGAHLRGQPLNHQLVERDGRLLATTTTAPTYRLHALGTTPPKPGLVRVASGGAAIEVEVWSLSVTGFATFTAAVPRPLAIGKVELADGRSVPGFVCEPIGLESATDITEFGGWRSYLVGP
jgi:allophanate hydrolase